MTQSICRNKYFFSLAETDVWHGVGEGVVVGHRYAPAAVYYGENADFFFHSHVRFCVHRSKPVGINIARGALKINQVSYRRHTVRRKGYLSPPSHHFKIQSYNTIRSAHNGLTDVLFGPYFIAADWTIRILKHITRNSSHKSFG